MMVKRPRHKKESGIALFMVMSALAVLTIVISEMTYSVHMQSRLAYNYVDGLKSFYNAKAGYKIGLLRLSLYRQVRELLGDEKNKLLKAALPDTFIDKIWNFPFVYPIPLPADASTIQKDSLKKFADEASLEGAFQIQIESVGARLNLNNLLVTVPPAPSPGAAAKAPTAPTPTPTPTPAPGATALSELNFRPIAEDQIDRLLVSRKETDREFAEIYRDVVGRDIVDAFMAYLKPSRNQQRPNLPGADDIIPKDAPLYSMGELHLIKGIDDTLFDLIEPSFTIFSTAGINVNTAGKHTLWGLTPEMTEEEINTIMKNRDDPSEGKPFENEEKYWEAVGKTSAAPKLNEIKERLTKAGLRITTTEENFRIKVTSRVGQAIRNIEAVVIIENRQNQPTPPTQNTPILENPAQNPSTKKTSALNLVYWRLY